jgi:hypothetical protein
MEIRRSANSSPLTPDFGYYRKQNDSYDNSKVNKPPSAFSSFQPKLAQKKSYIPRLLSRRWSIVAIFAFCFCVATFLVPLFFYNQMKEESPETTVDTAKVIEIAVEKDSAINKRLQGMNSDSLMFGMSMY